MITDEMIEKVADAIRGDLTRSSEWSEVARGLARIALEAAYPLIAVQVLKKAENIVTGLSYERFEYEDIAEDIRALKSKYEVSK